MLKEKIIEVATSEILRLGIKECRMDYIASSLSISKKTIYEHFGSKQNLLYECLRCFISKNIDQVKKEEANATSPLFAIARINSIVLSQTLIFCPAFHHEVQQRDDLSKLVNDEYVDYVHKCYLRFLTQGKQDGIFENSTNIPHTLSFFDQQIHNMYEKKLTDTVMKIDNYSFIILTYLAGICTDKGRKELKNIRKEIF